MLSKRREGNIQRQCANTQKTWFLSNHSADTSTHSFLLHSNIFISDYVMFLLYCLVGARLIFLRKNKTIFVIFGLKSPLTHKNITEKT